MLLSAAAPSHAQFDVGDELVGAAAGAGEERYASVRAAQRGSLFPCHHLAASNRPLQMPGAICAAKPFKGASWRQSHVYEATYIWRMSGLVRRG